MSGLVVNGRYLSESEYFDGENYNYAVLNKWKQSKVLIECPCQQYGKRAIMHIRRTKSGKLIIASNPFQAHNHTLTCSRYGKEERTQTNDQPVEYDGEKMVIRLQLFHERKGHNDHPMQDDIVLMDDYRMSVNGETPKDVKPTFSFSDFIYTWYQEAIKEIQRQRAKRTRKSVLYFMYRLMVEHRIWIGTKNFIFYGYIPNQAYKTPKKQKVVVGWVKDERVIQDIGKWWVIEGLGGETVEIVVKNNHLPSYPTKDKLAALRVNFGDGKGDPYTISSAKAWRITERGWWLHSEGEWELLKKLEDRGIEVGRPLFPSEKWLGYQPDFIIRRKGKLVFLDVVDPLDERLIGRDYREKQYEVFQEASKSGAISYIQYRLGDQLKI